MSDAVTTEAYVKEYVRLRAVAYDLKKFIDVRYVARLAPIGLRQASALVHDGKLRDCCEHCVAMPTTHFDAKLGLWFEWNCGGDTYTSGRCPAHTDGWYVSLEDIADGLGLPPSV